jgi:hypothetical protein
MCYRYSKLDIVYMNSNLVPVSVIGHRAWPVRQSPRRPISDLRRCDRKTPPRRVPAAVLPQRNPPVAAAAGCYRYFRDIPATFIGIAERPLPEPASAAKPPQSSSSNGNR